MRKGVVESFALPAKFEDEALEITRCHLERDAGHEPLEKRDSVRSVSVFAS